MAGPVNKVSIVLNGTIDERAASELSGPVATQGAAITLRRSENTRLGESVGTCVRMPEAVFGSTGNLGTQRVRSITSASAGKASLALMDHGYNERIGEDGTLSGNGSGFPTTANHIPSDLFFPGHIPESGSCPGQPARPGVAKTLAVDAFSGLQYIYHAYTVPVPGSFADEYDIHAYITDTDGALIASPQIIATDVVMTGIVYLTTHNSGQVNLWYDNKANVVTFVITHAGNNQLSASASTTTTIATGGSAVLFAVTQGFYLNHAGTPVTTYANYAYIVASLIDVSPTVYRVDVASAYAVVTGNTHLGTFGATGCCSLAFHLGTLGVVTQSNTTLRMETYNAALALQTFVDVLVDPAGPLGTGGTACGFVYDGTAAGTKLLALTVAEEGGPGSGIYSTRVYASNTAYTTLTLEDNIAWMTPASQGSQMSLLDTAGGVLYFPVFELVRNYGYQSWVPTSDDYVPDPDVQLWTCRSSTDLELVPVARYGTLRGTASPASVNVGGFRQNGPVFLGDLALYATYTKADLGAPTLVSNRTSRWLKIDFSPTQFRGATDRDGSTLVAASLPFEWDSVRVSDLGGPLYTPKVFTDVGVGSWPAPEAGEYTIAAVYTWTDGAGKKHRSSPGLAVFDIAAGQGVSIYVTAPVSLLRRGADVSYLECELYASSATSTTLTRQNQSFVVDAFGWAGGSTFGFDDTGAQIYSAGSAGEEQTPQPPCPLKDITIIGDRAWGIDAEMPSRLVHSKRRVAGIGYEWYPGYEVLLPSGAGDAVAIREWQGAVAVFAQYAIFIVSGDGPDNLVGNPSGGGFSKPQKVSDLGTTVAASVVSTPAGIAFQRDEDMMLFQGGAPKYLSGPLVSEECVGVTLFRDADEAVFFFPSRQLVWNYDAGKWTTWTLVTDAGEDLNVTAVAPMSYEQDKVMLVHSAASTSDVVYVVDSRSKATQPMLWETDWVILGGDFQDHVLLQHLVFSARRAGAHGVTFELFTNYSDTASTTRAYTAAEITTLASGPARYTIKVQPSDRGTRAVKLRVTETELSSSLGMVPVSLTLYYSLEGALMEPAIRPGAFK